MKRVSVAQFRSLVLTSTEPLEVSRYQAVIGWWRPGAMGEPKNDEDWSLETFRPGSKLAQLAARNEELAEEVKGLKRQLAGREPGAPLSIAKQYAISQSDLGPNTEPAEEGDLFAALDRAASGSTGEFNSKPFTPVPKPGDGKKKRTRGKPPEEEQ